MLTVSMWLLLYKHARSASDTSTLIDYIALYMYVLARCSCTSPGSSKLVDGFCFVFEGHTGR